MRLIMDYDGRFRSERLDGRLVPKMCHSNSHRACSIQCMHCDLDEANSEARFYCMQGTPGYMAIVMEAKKRPTSHSATAA
jgi:hypothetical protein